MKAALLYEPGKRLVIEELRLDDPAPGEVRIRSVASGVCHTDLSIADGLIPWTYPAVLGHEVAGVVEQVGAGVTRLKPGDHVVTCPSGFCGACEDCLQGHMNRCSTPRTRRPRDLAPRLRRASPDEGSVSAFFEIGGFASELLVSERTCVAIPKEMPLESAAIFGCAIVTGFGAVIHSARIEVGQTVAILGCGGVGLAAINAAAIAGAGRVIAIDRVPAKLELARRMGATDLINADEVDSVAAVKELTKVGVHHALEVIGLKSTIEQAFAMLRRGGTATIVGIPRPGTPIELDSFEFAGEKKIQGSLMGSNQFPVDVPRFVELYLQGKLKIDELISERIELEQINEGFDRLRSAEILGRSVITFQ